MIIYNDDKRAEIVKRNFLQIIIEGKYELSCEEAEARVEWLGLHVLQPPLVAVVISPEYTSVEIMAKDQLLFDVERYVCKLLDEFGYDGASITDSCCRVVSVISIRNKKTNATELDEVFATIRDNILRRFSLDSFIGIGSVVDQINKINTSYVDAQEMLAYRFQYSSRGVINISNILRFSHARFVDNNYLVDKVIGSFQNGDLGKIAISLDELINQVRYRPGVSKTSIRRVMIELIIKVLNIASNADVDVDQVLDGKDPYRWILEQDHTEILREWFLEICSKLLERIQANKQGGTNVLVQQACRYVSDNLHRNDLSLIQVSEYVGLSSAYFSQLFKQEVGEGLSAYITRNRVERSKDMLISSSLKVEDIAFQNGFSSSNYFSTVFKNITGYTPVEYRKIMVL